MIIDYGVADQGFVEDRSDVLVYTSGPLEHDLEITGPVKMELYASSSAVDTDFTAKLVDVRPDGYAHNLQDGIIRARFRTSVAQPSFIEPGRVYRYTIDLGSTSHVIRAGHRIRVDVSSSNFPRFDRNPNTGAPLGVDARLESAQQTIHHSAGLPVENNPPHHPQIGRQPCSSRRAPSPFHNQEITNMATFVPSGDSSIERPFLTATQRELL